MPSLTGEDVLQFYVAQLRLAFGNQVADDEVTLAPLHDQLRQALSVGWRLALLRLGDGRRNLGLTLLFGFARGHREVLHNGRGGGIRDQRWVVRRLDAAARGGARGAEQEGQEGAGPWGLGGGGASGRQT